MADPSGRTVYSMGLQPLTCSDCGFKSCRGHGCLVCYDCCVLSGRGLCIGLTLHFCEKDGGFWVGKKVTVCCKCHARHMK